MNAHPKVSGGRERVRRIFVSVALLVSSLTPIARLTAAGDAASMPAVTVGEERGVYSVTARFQVPQSPAAVLAVLTDYEHIPRFMPGVEKSAVLERAPGRAVVQQEAVSRLMMFSKHVSLVLEITEGADTLSFRDRSGRSFARYEGRGGCANRTAEREFCTSSPRSHPLTFPNSSSSACSGVSRAR
jgi:hypothetical protein